MARDIGAKEIATLIRPKLSCPVMHLQSSLFLWCHGKDFNGFIPSQAQRIQETEIARQLRKKRKSMMWNPSLEINLNVDAMHTTPICITVYAMIAFNLFSQYIHLGSDQRLVMTQLF